MPRILRNVSSWIPDRMHMATEEMRMNVTSIGISLFHVMNLLYLKAMNAEVVRASRPDNAVASPYDGIR